MPKARIAEHARRLADIPNIGQAMVEDFRNLGIEHPHIRQGTEFICQNNPDRSNRVLCC